MGQKVLALLYSVPARPQPQNCVRITTLKLLRKNNKEENWKKMRSSAETKNKGRHDNLITLKGMLNLGREKDDKMDQL